MENSDNKRRVGILNISGVACHLNSALQLLFHSLSLDTTHSLIRLTDVLQSNLVTDDGHDVNYAKMFVYRLGAIGHDIMFQRLEASPINPLEFYSIISKQVDPNDLGDAGSCITVLLDTLRKSLQTIAAQVVSEQTKLAESLLEQLSEEFWKGTLIHHIQGVHYEVLHRTNQVKKITLSRPTQERVLPCPWILPTRRGTKHISSLDDSILHSLSAQTIRGFQWDIEKEGTSVSESIIDVTDDEDSDQDTSSENSSDSDESSESSSNHENCTTVKYSRLGCLPRNILVRLKRFEFKDHQVHIVSDPMNIPKILDLTRFISHSPEEDSDKADSQSLMRWRYRLKGAIVYVTENAEELDDVGHYVTYLDVSSDRSQHAGLEHPSSLWVLVDDDKVVTLDDVEEERVISLFSGRLCKLKADTDLVSVGFATVLLYESLPEEPISLPKLFVSA
jgi:uncharacterized UBP type Zn finger protein